MRNLFRKLIPVKKPDTAQLFADHFAPRDLGFEIVTEGNPSHSHQFTIMPWDHERFGDVLVNADHDPGTPIAFPMGTFRDLFRCNCGAEGIKSERALI